MSVHLAVIGVIKYSDKFLFLKRNPERKYAPGLWEFVSGHIGSHETVDEAILRETLEETKLKCNIIKRGRTIETEEPSGTWILIPFLLNTESADVVIGYEHVDYKWINLEDYVQFEHVSGVKKVFETLGIL